MLDMLHSFAHSCTVSNYGETDLYFVLSYNHRTVRVISLKKYSFF